MPETQQGGEQSFRGIPVSAGVCRGKILVLGRGRPDITKLQLSEPALPRNSIAWRRPWSRPVIRSLAIQRKVSAGMGAQEGSIFDAHLLVLEDRTLIDEVVRVIQEQKVNAEHAFHTAPSATPPRCRPFRGRLPAGAGRRYARRDDPRVEQFAGPGGGGGPAPPQGTPASSSATT